MTDSAKAHTVAPFRTKPASTGAAREDATFEFASESKVPERRQSSIPDSKPLLESSFPESPIRERETSASGSRRPLLMAIAGLVALLLVAGAAWAALTLRNPGAPTGTLNVETDPPGAEVRIDDAVRGTTPLALTLPEGHHTMVVQRGSNSKQMAIEVSKDTSKTYHFEWAEAPAPGAAAETGSLSVVSDAPGSVVLIDGAERGQTPLTVRDLVAGRHEVLVRNANTTYQRSVQVEAGTTASLVVGGAPAAAAAWGWITLKAPFPVQVVEGGRVIGTSELDRVMLSPGMHQLDFTSDAFGFRQSLKVPVTAGRGAPISLTIPRVAMNINALPWAEVYVDGAKIGDTPLANVMQTLGDHEIVFRNPQFGEKRQVTRVTLKDSPRVSVDMRTQ